MPLYEIDGEHLRRYDAARFAALGLYERKDLQRLLRDDIAVLSPDPLVVAEEFGNWDDSRHRVDPANSSTEPTGRSSDIGLRTSRHGSAILRRWHRSGVRRSRR